MPIAVQWWAVWYPGRRAGRRQLHRAADAGVEVREGRARRRALLQRRALRAAAVALDPRRRSARSSSIPQLSDIQAAFPNLDPQPARPRHRVSGDAEVPAGRLHRPDGGRPHRGQLVDDPHAPQLGRVVPGARLLPALHQEGRDREALRAWWAVSPPSASSCCPPRTVYLLDTAKDAFDIILQIGAGTGLLYLVRWFWWRVNAWCEVVAMISSFARVDGPARAREERRSLQHARRAARHDRGHDGVLGGRRPTWGPQTDRRGARRVLQEGPAVRPGLATDPRGSGPRERTPRARRATTSRSRCSAGSPAAPTIWSALFAVGNFLYGRTAEALTCTAVFVIAGLVLIRVVSRLWQAPTQEA